MTDQEAFMGLGYAKKGKGMSEVKWVQTEVTYLWVSGANCKLKFDKIKKNNKGFQQVWCLFCVLMCLPFYSGVQGGFNQQKSKNVGLIRRLNSRLNYPKIWP